MGTAVVYHKEYRGTSILASKVSAKRILRELRLDFNKLLREHEYEVCAFRRRKGIDANKRMKSRYEQMATSRSQYTGLCPFLQYSSSPEETNLTLTAAVDICRET